MTRALGESEGKKCGGESVDADGRRRCEGLRCTDAEFANASSGAALSGRLVFLGKLKVPGGGESVDADGRPSCKGFRCTDAEFANESSTCCGVRQTCAQGKDDGLSCGGGLVDADGNLLGAKCTGIEFSGTNSLCCIRKQTCAESKSSNFSCGGGSVDADGDPVCAGARCTC